MPWKNERLECYGVLRTVTASFEPHSYLRLTVNCERQIIAKIIATA